MQNFHRQMGGLPVVVLGIAIAIAPNAPAFSESRTPPVPGEGSKGYGCIQGDPNGTFQGDSALTRFEFATGLKACLEQIERQLEGMQRQGEGVPSRQFQQHLRELEELRNRLDSP